MTAQELVGIEKNIFTQELASIQARKVTMNALQNKINSAVCVFRPKANTYFGIFRTPISVLREHPFRFLPNSDFGFTRTLKTACPNTYFGLGEH